MTITAAAAAAQDVVECDAFPLRSALLGPHKNHLSTYQNHHIPSANIHTRFLHLFSAYLFLLVL